MRKKSATESKDRKLVDSPEARQASSSRKRKTTLAKLAAGSLQTVGGKNQATCAAIRRDGSSYCRRPPGWGTSHPGTGRCKLHGGCSTGPKTGPGTYRKIPCIEVLTPEERQRYEELAASDRPAPLKDLLAWLRIMLERQIVKSATLMQDGASLADVTQVTDIIGATIERISRVSKKDADIQRVFQVEMKQDVFDRIIRTIKAAFDYANNLDTPEQRAQAFADRLRVFAVQRSGERGGAAEGIGQPVAGDPTRYH